jgi:hypothetical protein
MDMTSVIEFVTCFVIIWSILVMGTLAWRQFVVTRRATVSMDQISSVETIHAQLAVEAAAVARARQRRH